MVVAPEENHTCNTPRATCDVPNVDSAATGVLFEQSCACFKQPRERLLRVKLGG